MICYLCSPYRGDTQKNIGYACECSRRVVMRGDVVIAPHLYYPNFLDDNNEAERQLGMQAALDLIRVCDRLIVCVKFGYSTGMHAEIQLAQKLNIPIEEIT